MPLNQYATYREIKSQAAAWQNALEVARSADLPQTAPDSQVIFMGCGSTYYLSLAAAGLFQELTGCAARAAPAGALLLNPQTIVGRTLAPYDLQSKSSAGVVNPTSLLIAISRSGTTTETVKAAEKFRAIARGDVLAITNYN